MDRIVVGVGGSGAGMRALEWSGELARRTGAELRVVSAFGPSRPVSRARHDELEAERRAEVESWLGPTRSAGVECHVELVYGDPRLVLRDAAADPGTDLVVVGRRGPGGGPGLFHVSSVVEYLVHHVTAPFAVISGDGAAPLGRIVVGVDGSADAHAAARWCADLVAVAAPEAEVWAVTVEGDSLVQIPEVEWSDWVAATEDLIRDELAVELTRAGVTTHPVAILGRSAVAGLLSTAAEHEADLVVVGMRGIGGFTGLRVGGVAVEVLHAAAASVVLVPRR